MIPLLTSEKKRELMCFETKLVGLVMDYSKKVPSVHLLDVGNRTFGYLEKRLREGENV